MLYRGTQDGRVLAYDFKTGKRLWATTIADPKIGETVPAAPIAWDGMVYVGQAGGDYKGVKGRMYGLDAKTGKIVWEFYLVPYSKGDPVRGPLGKSPGRRPRSILRLARSTSRGAIRRPISRSEFVRVSPDRPQTSTRGRLSSSTPKPVISATTTISARTTGTTGMSRTRQSL
jgi:hypothetical protein